MAKCLTWKEKNSKIINLNLKNWKNYYKLTEFKKKSSIKLKMGKIYTNLYESLEILK